MTRTKVHLFRQQPQIDTKKAVVDRDEITPQFLCLFQQRNLDPGFPPTECAFPASFYKSPGRLVATRSLLFTPDLTLVIVKLKRSVSMRLEKTMVDVTPESKNWTCAKTVTRHSEKMSVLNSSK